MSWFSAALALLKIVGQVLDYLHKQGIIDDAMRGQLASQLLDISNRTKSVNVLKSKIAAMSDSDVDKRLQQRGDFRD